MRALILQAINTLHRIVVWLHETSCKAHYWVVGERVSKAKTLTIDASQLSDLSQGFILEFFLENWPIAICFKWSFSMLELSFYTFIHPYSHNKLLKQKKLWSQWVLTSLSSHNKSHQDCFYSTSDGSGKVPL